MRIGWPDQFIEHATGVDDLRKKYGLTPENILTRVKAVFNGTAIVANHSFARHNCRTVIITVERTRDFAIGNPATFV